MQGCVEDTESFSVICFISVNGCEGGSALAVCWKHLEGRHSGDNRLEWKHFFPSQTCCRRPSAGLGIQILAFSVSGRELITWIITGENPIDMREMKYIVRPWWVWVVFCFYQHGFGELMFNKLWWPQQKKCPYKIYLLQALVRNNRN